jgi:hypothetical protein
MKKVVIALFLTCILHPLPATEQFPDLFIYNNQILYIRDLPIDILSSYLPIEVNNQILASQTGYSTGCYRGYVATWKLENDSLFLVKLENIKGKELALEKYFPGKNSPKGVFADWFNHIIKAGMKDIMFSEKYLASIRFKGRFKNGILQEIL